MSVHIATIRVVYLPIAYALELGEGKGKRRVGSGSSADAVLRCQRRIKRMLVDLPHKYNIIKMSYQNHGETKVCRVKVWSSALARSDWNDVYNRFTRFLIEAPGGSVVRVTLIPAPRLA